MQVRAGDIMTPPEREMHAPLASPAGTQRRGDPSPQEYVREAQRIRILSAMVQLACDRGAQSAVVTDLLRLAGVSRSAFYDLFDDRTDCLLQAFEEAVALATERASARYEIQVEWVERVRAGLFALLGFLDEEPELAQLCIVQALAAPPAILARRGEVLDQLTRVIDEGRVESSLDPAALTAEAAVCGALGVIHSRLLRPGSGALIDLVNPIMSVIVLPYLGGDAARRELARPVADTTPPPANHRRAFDPVGVLDIRLTYRALEILVAIAAEPGLNNRQVGTRAGVMDASAISSMLKRLAGGGLIESTGPGPANGGANAWRLTARGKEVEKTIRRESIPGSRGAHDPVSAPDAL
jgi:AcrR family transcriptional regulator/DNA-binding MarR family transcriptional regulator